MAKPSAKSPNLAQELFNDTLEQHPQLVPHAELIAQIIIDTATAVHERTRGHLIVELSDHVGTFYNKLAQKKTPKKALKEICAEPERLYRVAIKAVGDATHAMLQQFGDNFDDFEVEATDVRGNA